MYYQREACHVNRKLNYLYDNVITITRATNFSLGINCYKLSGNIIPNASLLISI